MAFSPFPPGSDVPALGPLGIVLLPLPPRPPFAMRTLLPCSLRSARISLALVDTTRSCTKIGLVRHLIFFVFFVILRHWSRRPPARKVYLVFVEVIIFLLLEQLFPNSRCRQERGARCFCLAFLATLPFHPCPRWGRLDLNGVTEPLDVSHCVYPYISAISSVAAISTPASSTLHPS